MFKSYNIPKSLLDMAVVTLCCKWDRLDPDALYLAQVLIEKQLYCKLELNFSYIFSFLRRLNIYILFYFRKSSERLDKLQAENHELNGNNARLKSQVRLEKY